MQLRTSHRHGRRRGSAVIAASTPRVRALALAISIAHLLSLGGCGDDSLSVPTLEERIGTVIFGPPMLPFPDRGWRASADGGQWLVATGAELLLPVREATDFSLWLDFQPAGEAPPFEILWVGPDGTRERLATTQAESAFRLELTPERLVAGLHRLIVVVDANVELALSTVRARLGEASIDLEPGQRYRYWFVSDLLSFGVTGSEGAEKNGGFVVLGAQPVPIRLPSHDGQLSFRVQNSSHEPAVFRLEARGASTEVRLAPHERAALRLPLRARRPWEPHTATATVEGSNHGLFLWGAPHFRQLGGEDPRSAASPATYVLITLDTMRRDALGSYLAAPDGGEAPAGPARESLTPRLDAFAQGADVVEHAYSTSPWTLPSHASMFTGLAPSRHGAGVVTAALAQDHATLAEQLRAAGISTLGFAGGTLAGFRFGLAQGFDRYFSPSGLEIIGDSLADSALEALDNLPDEAPAFLFINFFDAHYPYLAPADQRARFRLEERLQARSPNDPWRRAVEGDASAFRRLIDREVPLAADGVELLHDAYRAEVAFVDAQFGRLIDHLDALGRLDSAMVVVLADHGEFFGEGGYFSHSNRLDPPLLEIPLFVKWPGQRSGRRLDALASSTDVFTTFLSAAGLEPPRADGVELVEAQLARRTQVVAEEHEAPLHSLFESMRVADHLFAVQQRAQRLLAWETERRCQRGEPGRWSATSCPPEFQRAAEQRLEALRRDARPPLVRIEASPEERAKLKALGYL
ncbi:MAG: sulfatase [Acidobacteriota bacterium]